MSEEITETTKSVAVFQYGLMNPINWADDCFEHLYLQTKLWNRLVEIERENRAAYRAIVGTDEAVAEIDAKIAEVKSRLSSMDTQRKEIRKEKRSKQSVHTEPLDEAIKAAKSELKELSAQAKEIRAVAKERIKAASTAIKDNDDRRKELVKEARNASGLWWGNYNAVCASYETGKFQSHERRRRTQVPSFRWIRALHLPDTGRHHHRRTTFWQAQFSPKSQTPRFCMENCFVIR